MGFDLRMSGWKPSALTPIACSATIAMNSQSFVHPCLKSGNNAGDILVPSASANALKSHNQTHRDIDPQ